MSLLRRKAGLQPVTKKKKTVEELEKENKLLREQLLRKTIENELLKKLQALAQEEEKKKENTLGFILETINSTDSLPSLPRSVYNYWEKRVDPDSKYADLMDAITRIFNDNHKRYGYRRITLQLKNEGWIVNHKTVKRLMSKLHLYGITPRAKYKSYKGDLSSYTRR